jgi:hypothetical protein
MRRDLAGTRLHKSASRSRYQRYSLNAARQPIEYSMAKSGEKQWREQTHFCSQFSSGSDTLTITGIRRHEGDSPNGITTYTLEFFGECEDGDGELIKRRKRYNITGQKAAAIVDSFKALALHENEPPPKMSREYFAEAGHGFIVSLKRTPEKRLFVVRCHRDGWKVETEDRDSLFDAFCNAAQP